MKTYCQKSNKTRHFYVPWWRRQNHKLSAKLLTKYLLFVLLVLGDNKSNDMRG